MRIVSSDGRLDIPYEWVIVRNDDGSLIAFDYNYNVYRIGKYNSRERARYVMGEIRNAYMLGRKVYTMPEN